MIYLKNKITTLSAAHYGLDTDHGIGGLIFDLNFFMYQW